MPTKIFRQLLHKTILKPNLLLNHNTLMVLLTKLPLPKLIKDFKILPTIKISPSTLLVNKLIVSLNRLKHSNQPKQLKQLNLNNLRPLPNLDSLKSSLNPHKANRNLLNLNLLNLNLLILNHSSSPNSSNHHHLTNSSNHTNLNLLHQLHQLVQTILPASSPHQPHNNF